MDNDLKTAEFSCLKRLSGPDAIRLAREFEKCPFTPTAKEILYNYYQSIGAEISYEDICRIRESNSPFILNNYNTPFVEGI